MNKLQEKAMLVSFSVSVWTAQKQDKEVARKAEEAYGAYDAGKYVKRLVDKKIIDEIAKVARKARVDVFYKYTLPWNDDGLRILPADLFLKFNEEAEKYKNEFWKRVEDFISQYVDILEHEKQRLNGMFKPSDYPDEYGIRRKFAFEYNVYPLPDKDDFRISLSEEEMERIKQDLEKTILKTTREGIEDIWRRLYEKINKIVVNLEDKPDGKRKKIYDSLLGNVAELVELLPGLNIFNDPKLDEIRKQIEKDLLVFSTDQLKNDAYSRKTAQKKAKDIIEKMEAYY